MVFLLLFLYQTSSNKLITSVCNHSQFPLSVKQQNESTLTLKTFDIPSKIKVRYVYYVYLLPDLV